jgi:LuxR family maltose regulon positive regulatory protein
LIVEAIHHGLLAEDWEHVINLITQHGMDLVLLGRVQTVLGWLRELPKHTLHASFAISLVYGSALLFTNQFARAEDYLAEAQRLVEQQPNTAHNSYLLAQVLAMRASTPILSGDVALCDYYARQSLALLSPSQSVWYAGILTLVCNGYLLSGDVGSAWEELAAYAIAAAQPCNNRLALLHSIVSLARIHHLQGRLRQAMLTYQEMLQWVTGWDELVGIVSGPAYFFGLGNVLREQNQFDAAEQLFDRGVAAIAAMGVADAEFLLRGYIALAQLKQAQGQTEAASAVLNAFATLMHERAYHPSLVENLEAARARIALLDGQIAVAAAWANNANISPDDPINFLREDIYLTLIRVRIAQNALESIFPLLDRLLSDAETKARGNSIIEILVLRALAFHRSSNIDHAMQELTRALAFAEPEGYVRTFVDEGAPMVALLQEARARGVQPDYCERLLNAFPHLSYTAPPTKLAAAQSPVPGADLVEVLNERELEILRLIALGHSNREIADHLMVALSTVKWHINNMYGKLNVSTRTQALVRAGELGLL